MKFLFGAAALCLLSSAPCHATKVRHAHGNEVHKKAKPSLRKAHGAVSLLQEKATLLPKNESTPAVSNVTTIIKTMPDSMDAFWKAELQLLVRDEKTFATIELGASFVLAGVAILVSTAFGLLLTCCLYDGMSAWRHHARYRACKRQIKNLHQCLNSKQGDLALCPCCVEHISPQRSAKKIVFLCGHRFHTECSNAWYAAHPEVLTQCPVCVEDIPQSIEKQCCNKADQVDDVHAVKVDGAVAFMLGSLNMRYPEIVTEDCMQRWMNCHTEIWLSELMNPKYNSYLRPQSK